MGVGLSDSQGGDPVGKPTTPRTAQAGNRVLEPMEERTPHYYT